MTKYYIPKDNLNKLESLVKKLQKKTGVKFSYNENDRKQEYLIVEDTKLIYTTVGVELEVNYKVGDYELVAEIEHHGENIIRHINLNYEVPETYRSCSPYCEHCHTTRDRKYTYLLVDKEGNYKLVGKGCLKDYTGIDDLSLINLVSKLNAFLETDYTKDEEFLNIIRYSKYDPLTDIANIFYQVILNYGYDGVYNACQRMSKYNYRKDLEKEVNEILNVVNTDWYNNSEYCHNVKVILSMDYIENRNWGLLVSYINSAMKYLQSKNIKNEYLGKEEDRIQFQVKSYKVLFTNYNKYSYNSEPIYTYRIITTTNNIVIWKTSHDLKDNEIVKATIKELKEYKGEKQTVVTRGSIISEESMKGYNIPYTKEEIEKKEAEERQIKEWLDI